MTRPGTGGGAAVRVASHRRSIARSASSGTRWSAASTRLTSNRAVATRYDKPAVRFEAVLVIASINEWLTRQ
jgi:hypothetical protein